MPHNKKDAIGLGLDDLIPAELKEHMEKSQGGSISSTPPRPDPTTNAPTDPSTPPREPTIEPPAADPAPIPPAQDPPFTNGKVEFDFSLDNIDKMLAGDTSAILKKPAQDPADPGKEEKPFWHEDEDYKQFTTKAFSFGLQQKEVDDLLRNITDKSTVDTSKYTQALEKEKADLIKKTGGYEDEFKRLKDIEKAVNFDMLPGTKEKYFNSMNTDMNTMHDILGMEGVDISARQLSAAKDKAEFSSIIDKTLFDDADYNRLYNSWRNYKSTEYTYNKDRQDAITGLNTVLQKKIPEDKALTIYRTNLSSLMHKEKDRYGYLHEAIMDDISKHEDESALVSESSANFTEMLNAMADPNAHLADSAWLDKMAVNSIRAAHNKNMEAKYAAKVQEASEIKDRLEKVVKAYAEAVNSSKGITGESTPNVPLLGVHPLNRAPGEHTEAALKAQREKMISFIDNPSEISIDELLDDF